MRFSSLSPQAKLNLAVAIPKEADPLLGASTVDQKPMDSPTATNLKMRIRSQLIELAWQRQLPEEEDLDVDEDVVAAAVEAEVAPPPTSLIPKDDLWFSIRREPMF